MMVVGFFIEVEEEGCEKESVVRSRKTEGEERKLEKEDSEEEIEEMKLE